MSNYGGACDWVGEFDDTEACVESTVKARKAHICTACHGPIPPGILYGRVFGVCGGEASVYRYHSQCLQLVKLNAELCGGYGWAFNTDLDDVMGSVALWLPDETEPRRRALMERMVDLYDEVLCLYHFKLKPQTEAQA